LACIRATCGKPQGLGPQQLNDFTDTPPCKQPWVDALLSSLKGRGATFNRYLAIQFMAVGWVCWNIFGWNILVFFVLLEAAGQQKVLQKHQGWHLFGDRYMVAALSLKKAGYSVLLLGQSDVAATWSSRSFRERSG